MHQARSPGFDIRSGFFHLIRSQESDLACPLSTYLPQEWISGSFRRFRISQVEIGQIELRARQPALYVSTENVVQQRKRGSRGNVGISLE